MTRQIVLEGSKKQIAEQIIATPGDVVRAVLWVQTPAPTHGVPSPSAPASTVANGRPSEEDEWTKDLRRWAAAHQPRTAAVDDDRESIYKERLQ